MTTRFRRPMLVLGTTILIMQAVFMPVGMVYAETTMDTEEQEQVELPPMKNYLEEEQASDPRFFFTQSRMQGTAKEPLQVTFFSDQEVSEARVSLPEEATLLKDQLSAGISVEQDSHSKEWVVLAQRVQNTFVLPLVFESDGNYEISVKNVTATVVISNEEGITGEILLEDSSSNDSSITPEREPSESDLNNYKEEDTKDNLLEEANTNDEAPSTRFSVNVSTWAQFVQAINDVNITVINLSANVTGNQNLYIRKDIIINGNGYTIDIQNNEIFLNASNIQFTLRDTHVIGQGASIFPIYGLNIDIIFSNVHFNGAANLTGNSISSTGARILFEGEYNTVKTDGSIRMPKEVKIASGSTVYHEGSCFINVDFGIFEETINSSTLIVEEEASLISNSKLPMKISNINVHGNMNIQSDSEAIQIPNLGSANQIINLFEGSEVELYSNNNANIFSVGTRKSNLNIYIAEDAIFDFKQNTGESIVDNNIDNISIMLSKSKLALWDLGLQEEKASMVFSDIEATLSGTNASVIVTTTNERFQTLYDSSGLAAYSRMSNRPVEEMTRTVIAKYLDTNGNEVADSEVITGLLGENYQTKSKQISGYQLIERPSNESGQFSREMIEVSYIYEEANVAPVDPLDPEIEIDPENKPQLPEEQGRLSIDFVSQFNFGTQSISATDQTYFAQPQRLLNQDGTVNETEERPNYIQVSDRRSETERHGWQLAVTQNTQFENDANHQLTGAQLRLTNQQLATAQDGSAPELQQTNPLALIPGVKRVLLMAQGEEGQGTWIYRFGDLGTASESVALTVPKGATPEATAYKATLTWELSAVPGN